MAPSARRLKLQGRYLREFGAPVGPSAKTEATSAFATQSHPMAKRTMAQQPGTTKPTGAKGSKQAKQPGSKKSPSMKRPAGATTGATGTKKPAGGTQSSTTPPGVQADMAATQMELAAGPPPPIMAPTAGGNKRPSGGSPWIERKVYNLTGKNFTCKAIQVDYGVPGGFVRIEWLCW